MELPKVQKIHCNDVRYLDADPAVRAVTSEYADIPETSELTWKDDFFDDDDGVVAAFDFNYEQMETCYSSVIWCYLGLSILYIPIFITLMAGLTPCYLQRNVQWRVQAQHISPLPITRDGIRFVRNRRRTCWGCTCTDAGKSSKPIPFDKITDCDIKEPAGNTCVIIPNVLTTVNVDTASHRGPEHHEFQIAGLKNARRFQKIIWAMKRHTSMTSLEMTKLHQWYDRLACCARFVANSVTTIICSSP